MGERILIVAPSWVGDMVMTQPMLALLAARHAGAAIDVFAPQWVLPLARRMAEVAAGIVNPLGHGALALRRRFALGQQLAQQRYDQAIVLPNSWKSALPPFFAGIPRRTGFLGEFRHGLLNDARRLDPAVLPRMVQRFAALAGNAGEPLPDPLPVPRLTASTTDARSLAAQLDLATDGPIAVLCPGAEFGPAKRWPVRHFATLADQLGNDGFRVWLLGSAKDAEITTAIATAARCPIVDLAGRTSLDQAVDLMALATIVVTNDSGLMHVAAALDRPTIALFGSSSPAFTPPLSTRARIVQHPVPCSPCFQRVCPLGHFDCMNRLDPGDVHRAVHQALTSTS